MLQNWQIGDFLAISELLWLPEKSYIKEKLAIAMAMDIREKLQRVVEQLNEEELSTLLDFAIFPQSKRKSAATMVGSHAYRDWLSAENDIYDELFTDELSTQ